jgi:hypothetical protein
VLTAIHFAQLPIPQTKQHYLRGSGIYHAGELNEMMMMMMMMMMEYIFN